MKEKDLRHMGRRDLIELIAAMKKRELELDARVKELEARLEDRNIKITNAGSLAEAALSVNGVFEAAEAAADAYLRSIKEANETIEARVAHTVKECRRVREEAERDAEKLLKDTEAQCVAMKAHAEAEIGKKWDEYTARRRENSAGE